MENIYSQPQVLSSEEKLRLKKHKPLTVWFTGLSGAGKSTLANMLEKELYSRNIHTALLDGDNLRGGLNRNLGFTEADRTENLRRVAEVAKLFVESGNVAIAAFITPLESDRQMVRNIIGSDRFLEVFVATSLEECENRDVKGLYKKARAGEIVNFTGISAPFEEPADPDLRVFTEREEPVEIVKRVLKLVEQRTK
ncbi:MAG: adenylyl-sulfate kinase [Salegentibacter sp.]